MGFRNLFLFGFSRCKSSGISTVPVSFGLYLAFMATMSMAAYCPFGKLRAGCARLGSEMRHSCPDGQTETPDLSSPKTSLSPDGPGGGEAGHNRAVCGDAQTKDDIGVQVLVAPVESVGFL